VLLGDLDGAVDGFSRGADESIAGGDIAFTCLGLLAGTLHIAGRHEEARVASEHVLERARSAGSGLWAWAFYCSLPFALELGHSGRHEEAIDFLRDLLEEGGVPRVPGVMTSVVIVLGALAAQRDDLEAAAVLLEYSGQAMISSGVRTPVDIAMHSKYLHATRAKLDPASAEAYSARGVSMSLGEALEYGMRPV
jgi:hypothetical protein